jgi:hypothetical protein
LTHPTPTQRLAALRALIVLSVGIAPLTAQQPVVLAPGAVVRWYDAPSGGRRIEAIVTGSTADSLMLQMAGGPAYRIAPATIPTIEVRGDRNSRGKKALTGAIIGTGIGLIVGIAANNTCNDNYWGCSSGSRDNYVAVSALGGALYGGIIGVLLSPGWQWHPLNAGGTTKVGISPRVAWRNGPMLGVQIRR